MSRTFGANSHLVLRVVLEETLDTTAGELTMNLSASRLALERRIKTKFGE
jgi:hypothetical protein